MSQTSEVENSTIRRLAEYPEPGEPRRRYDVKTSTPWGPAQSATYWGAGLIQYETAGHGGFYVSGSLLQRIPDYMQAADRYADGRRGWYEKDCASAIVVVCLPEFFPRRWRENAVLTVQRFYPEQWKRLCEARLQLAADTRVPAEERE